MMWCSVAEPSQSDSWLVAAGIPPGVAAGVAAGVPPGVAAGVAAGVAPGVVGERVLQEAGGTLDY